MSFTDVLPTVRTLSRADRFRLLQVLAHELAEDENVTKLEPGSEFPVWSPIEAYDASATMLRVLEEPKE